MFIRLVRIPLKLLKFILITLFILFGILLSLPYLFPDHISKQVRNWANKSIETELAFSRIHLSFFEHFPSLSLTLQDVTLKGSAPFEKDTLIAAKKVSLGVNLLSLLGSSVKINEIYLTDGRINVMVDKTGSPNYNVYSATTPKGTTKENITDTSSTSLKLEKIQIENCSLVYDDASIPIKITSSQLDYTGKGDLNKLVFDLKSRIQMKDVSLSFDNEDYIINKQLRARLITKVNTGSLQLVFEKNNVRINELPVRFKGRFDFLSNGYYMDFDLATRKATFKQLFTALPPAAVQWLNTTSVKGDVKLSAQLKGKYVASENVAPDLNVNLNVSNASVASQQTKTPVKNILLQLSCQLPSLSPDRLHLKVDTIHATLDKQFIAGSLEWKGMNTPFLKGNLSASADLAEWTRSLSTEGVAELRGMLNMKAAFHGTIDRAAGKLPVTFASVDLKNGFIKTSYYPNPISQLQLHVTLKNATGTNKDFTFASTPIAFIFEGKPFVINSEIGNLDNLQYNVSSKGVFDVGKISKVFGIEGLNIDGSIAANLQLKGSQEDIDAGRYDQLHHQGTLELHQINVRSNDYPHPLTIQDGIFSFQDDKMRADKIRCTYGSSHLTMDGHLSNIINYIMQDNAPLKGRFAVKADQVDLAELMGSSSTSESPRSNDTTSVTGIVPIPANLDLELAGGVDRINYKGIQLTNCNSVVAVKAGTLNIKKAAFEMVGAPFNFTGSYSPVDVKNVQFTATISAEEFDVSKAFQQIEFFKAMAPSAANVKGIVSLNYQLSGRLDDQMYPVLPSLKGGGVLTLKKVKLYGFKMLSEINKRTSQNLNESPDLTKIELKTTIEDNIMTLKRTKLRISGFRPRFEGQVSLDGKVNLQCRLGLPPFGLIGIPLSITGTQEKPVVKFRRGRKSDALKGTEDDVDDEDKAEAEAAAEAEAKAAGSGM